MQMCRCSVCARAAASGSQTFLLTRTAITSAHTYTPALKYGSIIMGRTPPERCLRMLSHTRRFPVGGGGGLIRSYASCASLLFRFVHEHLRHKYARALAGRALSKSIWYSCGLVAGKRAHSRTFTTAQTQINHSDAAAAAVARRVCGV